MQCATFTSARLSNIQRHCDARGCRLSRHGLSKYCRAHTRISSLYGHPLARALSRADYKAEYTKVKALLRSNADHEGVKVALRFVQQWIDAAVCGDQTAVAMVDIQRLEASGVTASDVLSEAAALSVWLSRNDDVLPSIRAVTFAFSRAVLSLAPREKRLGVFPGAPIKYVQPRNAALQGIGSFLRDNLSGFFANVQLAIEHERTHMDAAKAAMRTPLVIPLSFPAETTEGASVVPQQFPSSEPQGFRPST